MRKLTLVWALLIVATLVSSAYAHGDVLDEGSSKFRPIIIYAIALCKARFVILDMMDVRAAPVPLKVIMEVWVFGMWITLSALSAGLL